MALFKRVTAADHGLSKKSDSPEPRPPNHQSMHFPWIGLRRRRFLVAVLVVIAIYLFIHNIPTDVAPVGQRYNPLYGSMASGHSKAQQGLLARLKSAEQQNNPNSRLDESPIRFTELATSLRSWMGDYTLGSALFLILHPSSAAKVLPLACQMRKHGHNSVHVALMGNIQASPQDLMTLNGLNMEQCSLVWHDARPDHPKESSYRRIMASIVKGYSYLHSALSPSVILVDAVNGGDTVSLNLLETTISKLGTPLLKLPSNAVQSMPWLTMLDHQALGRLTKLRIDIVIQAHSESAGTMIRLLRSLKKANYEGLPIPRLTVELPSHADPFVVSYLSKFKWPPEGLMSESQLTIRRRIDLKQITPAEASLRTVEAFYPADPEMSHVLMLSPETELSPSYLHYLYFSMLHFKYGGESMLQSDRLMGISLELPQKAEDNDQPFLNPSITEPGPFLLSQNMRSNANLFFGDRWMEFHSFLSRRLELDPHLKKEFRGANVSGSNDQPQWTRHALELMQARGLYMLYPTFVRDGNNPIAVSHRELHRTPEEFVDEDEDTSALAVSKERPWKPSGKVLSGDSAPYQRILEANPPSPDMTLPSVLLGTSRSDEKDGIPPLGFMSLSSANGALIDWYDTESVASKYADAFSLGAGGCASLDQRDQSKLGTTDFLFCDSG